VSAFHLLSRWFLPRDYSSTLNMEMIYSSEMSVGFSTDYIALSPKHTNNVQEWTWKETVVVNFKELSHHLPEGHEDTTELLKGRSRILCLYSSP
jgi:hypothetical protein